MTSTFAGEYESSGGSISFVLSMGCFSDKDKRALLVDVEPVSLCFLLRNLTGDLKNFHVNRIAMAKPANAPIDPAFYKRGTC